MATHKPVIKTTAAARDEGRGDGNGEAFAGDVRAAVVSVRRRLGAVVEAVCGGSPRAQDITDRFGVYRKLGWQIWNVVYGDDPLAAIRHLPNARTLKVWNEAASKQGVDARLLQRLDEAIATFHQSADAHADDREMLFPAQWDPKLGIHVT